MESSTIYWILAGIIGILVIVTLISWAYAASQDGEIKKKNGELNGLSNLLSTLQEQSRKKEESLKETIQRLERLRDQLQGELRQHREHIHHLQDHAAFIEAMQKLALSCNRCGRLAYPITDTGNRYGCPCGNQFPGARHGLPTPRRMPPTHINVSEVRELEGQR